MDRGTFATVNANENSFLTSDFVLLTNLGNLLHSHSQKIALYMAYTTTYGKLL